jgi:hypothetical protein
MMGHRQVEQAALFYEFSLKTHVPTDHRLRSIDARARPTDKHHRIWENRSVESFYDDRIGRRFSRCRNRPLGLDAAP